MKPMNLGRARNLQRPEGVDTSSASSENDTLIGTTFTYTPGENARHYSDTMGIDIVTLNVGNKLFRVHKKKLCNAIPYFNKLFNTHNTNGKLENTATFLNDNPDYFDILLEWVYTGSLRTLEFTQTSNGVSFSWAPVEVYTLAHRFWVSQLMDSIMNEWIKCALLNDTLPSITSTAEIYAKAPPNSAPRKYAKANLLRRCNLHYAAAAYQSSMVYLRHLQKMVANPNTKTETKVLQKASSDPNAGTKINVMEPRFIELFGTEMVKLYVGPQKHLFRVHKKVLCEKIPYFRSMFEGGFKEAGENSASFPKDTVAAFDALLSWTYTGKLRPLPIHSMIFS
ncbi:hypothetical protein G7Y89_g11754 [Cudoniella acicularis]|uniref:BTB domain-containing protein n=1 Tax=Cudoniella acicularis TaxID=354080 RepID=A0A8H4RAA6_9HELO|nr:hypothetical protein G7Y89_g11754 [Cudoniella acicularis]